MDSQINSSFGREPAELADQELRDLTSFYRSRAKKGGLVPQSTLARCEAEMTRRFGGETTVAAPLGKGQPRWFERWLQ